MKAGEIKVFGGVRKESIIRSRSVVPCISRN
jgi:hypothetical protein